MNAEGHLPADNPIEESAEERTSRIEWERRAVQQALEEVERVGSIPFEDIEAWLDSIGSLNELPVPEPRK